MITLLVYILVLVLVFGAIFYVIRMVPIVEPFKSAAYIVLLIIFVLVLLSVIGIVPGPFHPLVT